MSNSKSATRARPSLRVIHGTGNPKAATLEDLRGVLDTMRVARKNGIDLTVQLHVGTTTVDVSNAEAAPAAQAVAAILTKVEPSPRFTKVSSDGYALLYGASEWEGVYDASTGLIWARKLLAGGERNWADSIKAAGESTLCGKPARAPTIQERLSIVDYTRNDPALDIGLFDSKEKNGWEWTSTPAAAPSGYAWLVNLGGGYSDRYDQSYHFRVRAVRAGQPLGI